MTVAVVAAVVVLAVAARVAADVRHARKLGVLRHDEWFERQRRARQEWER